MSFDFEPFWRLYRSGDWEPDTKAWLHRLEPGDLFVDVGAWCGPVSLWALERGARVIAVEPDPVAFAELERALAPAVDNGMAELWQGAIVAAEGEPAMLSANPSPGCELGDSMSRLAPELPDAFDVPAWTLPSILAGRVPRLAKIDVEGYETRLAPILVPWLLERGVDVQVSCHGDLPVISGIPDAVVTRFLPDARWGDLRIELA